MRGILKIIFLSLLTHLMVSCVEPYLPAVIEENPGFLVVNGMLNLNGSANIILTKSTAIYSDEQPPRVQGAMVTIEDETNNVFTLNEMTSGSYEAKDLSLTAGMHYRLRIRVGEDEYLSEFVEMKPSPPIDSITYSGSPDGLDINIHTHDVTGKSRYYKWNFVETWEYNARYLSTWRMVDGIVIPRPQQDYRYTCYKTVPLDRVVIESTTRLDDDKVSNFTLTTVPPASNVISRKYSIIVKQQVLTKEGYQYWETLKKSTEQVGGLFDPLPSQIEGNIVCLTNPEKKAIGFFTASGTSEQRIFISPDDLPAEYPKYDPVICHVDTTIFQPLVIYDDSDDVIRPVFNNGGISGYVSAAQECINCLFEGGVLTKPDFWD